MDRLMLVIDFLDEALLELGLARSGLSATDAATLSQIETELQAILAMGEECLAAVKQNEQAQTDAYLRSLRQAGISLIR